MCGKEGGTGAAARKARRGGRVAAYHKKAVGVSCFRTTMSIWSLDGLKGVPVRPSSISLPIL